MEVVHWLQCPTHVQVGKGERNSHSEQMLLSSTWQDGWDFRLNCRMILTRCRKARCYCNLQPLWSLQSSQGSLLCTLNTQYLLWLPATHVVLMPTVPSAQRKLSHFLKLLGHSRPQGSQQPDIHLLGTITTPLLPLLKPGNMTGTLYMMCQFIKQTWTEGTINVPNMRTKKLRLCPILR